MAVGWWALAGVLLMAACVEAQDCSPLKNCSDCIELPGCGFCASTDANCTGDACGVCIPGNPWGAGGACDNERFWYYGECKVPYDPTTVDKVIVGMSLVNIADLNLAAGSFYADFYLTFRGDVRGTPYMQRHCDQSAVKACFELINAGKYPTAENFTDYIRIKSTFFFQPVISTFPFDTQTLSIIVEDQTLDASKLQWDVVDDGVRKRKNLHLPGWVISNLTYFPPFQKENPLTKEKFDRLEFVVTLSRPRLNVNVKIFLPALFINIVILFSFSLPPKFLTTRTGTSGSMLMSAVMFHISVSNQLPASSALTIADRFMLATYCLIFLSLAVCFLLLRLQRTETDSSEKWCNGVFRITEFIAWAAVPPFYVIYFFAPEFGWRFLVFMVTLYVIAWSVFLFTERFKILVQTFYELSNKRARHLNGDANAPLLFASEDPYEASEHDDDTPRVDESDGDDGLAPRPTRQSTSIQ